MRSTLIKAIVGLAILGGVAFAGFKFVKGRGNNQPATEYETEEVVRTDLTDTVSATGVLQPLTTIDVKSNVGGEILTLAVDLGDYVTKGQLIALTDPTDPNTAKEQADADKDAAQARIDQATFGYKQEKEQVNSRIAAARHALSGAQARVESAKATMIQAEATAKAEPKIYAAQLAEAKAGVAQAKQALESARQRKRVSEATTLQAAADAKNNASQSLANMKTAERDYRRQRALLARGFVPVSDVETAYNRRETTKAAYFTALERANTIDKQNAATLSDAEAAITEAEARLKQAEATLARVEEDRIQIEVEEQRYKAAEAAYKQAQSAVEQSQAELEVAISAKHQIDIAQRDITTAEATMTRAKSSQTQANKNVYYTTIVAPRDGIVIKKYVEEGTVIASGRSSVVAGTNVVQLGDMSTIQALCQVDETDIAKVHKGQRCIVTADAYPQQPLDGVVVRVDPMAIEESNITTIPVTVNLLNVPKDLRPQLKPEMNVNCDFIVASKKGVLAVPRAAIKETDNGFVVTVLDDADQPADIPIEKGLDFPSMTEIISGVSPGQEVVTKIIEPEEKKSGGPFGNPFGVFGNRRRNNNRTRGGKNAGAGGKGARGKAKGGGGRR